MITENEIKKLESLYTGCKAYHGEMHDHSASGGTSDGKYPLSVWVEEMQQLKMDFAAILDHRQVRHMYLPEWKDGLFLGGSEPGTIISDSKAEKKEIHYNMLFTGPAPLEELLAEFPEFEFEGGPEGHFRYPFFTRFRCTHFGSGASYELPAACCPQWPQHNQDCSEPVHRASVLFPQSRESSCRYSSRQNRSRCDR